MRVSCVPVLDRWYYPRKSCFLQGVQQGAEVIRHVFERYERMYQERTLLCQTVLARKRCSAEMILRFCACVCTSHHPFLVSTWVYDEHGQIHRGTEAWFSPFETWEIELKCPCCFLQYCFSSICACYVEPSVLGFATVMSLCFHPQGGELCCALA